MRRRELERRLHRIGRRLERHGGNHDHWTYGQQTLPTLHHREIDEKVATATVGDAAPTGAILPQRARVNLLPRTRHTW